MEQMKQFQWINGCLKYLYLILFLPLKYLTRFVVTGHLQGEGLAQICLLYVITKFGKMIPEFVDDTKAPRFFGYFLSDPRVFVDQQTNMEYSSYINKFNMISHCAFRDIVPTVVLPNFSPLGCMAHDSVYDVLHCVVISKVASNYFILLLTILKRKIDQSLFYTDQDDYWRLISNPSLSICWNEVKIIIIKKGLDEKVSTRKGLFSLINDGLTFYRNRSQI
jgi:hypothetical protein